MAEANVAVDSALAVAKVWQNIGVIAGATLSIGITALATGYTQGKIGQAGCGAIAEKPEVAGTVFILVAIPETMVVLGFVIGAMILFFVK
ncbi:ATPase [Candidatus Desantisbacteria bacterium]|nr:ATPase [Candidatus Desantisbacteria bacterium]